MKNKIVFIFLAQKVWNTFVVSNQSRFSLLLLITEMACARAIWGMKVIIFKSIADIFELRVDTQIRLY